MRSAMATWLRISAIVGLICVVGVVCEEERAVGDFVTVHRHFPGLRRVHGEFNGKVVLPVTEDGEKKGLQWRFNPWNPVETFGVRKEGHGHKKCGMAGKFGWFWGEVFGHGVKGKLHEHHHEHRDGKWLGDREERHHLEREHEDEHHEEYHRHHHLHKRMRSSFGWELLSKIGRWFTGIPSLFSDVPELIKTWSARASGRKAPVVQTATEPLDAHALRKLPSPNTSCSLREKLLAVFTAVSEEVAVSAGRSASDDMQKDKLKSNLKQFMGDSMQLGIVKSVCDASSMSSCEQEFCDIFLSHPKSGVLMAFRILGLHPLRAAMQPEHVKDLVSSSRDGRDVVLTNSGVDMIQEFHKAWRLTRFVHQRILAKSSIIDASEEKVPDMTHKFKNIVSKTFDGELNPCKACLRQEIFRLKRSAKKAFTEACEVPTDAYMAQACKFVHENKFIAKTMFAYKFRLWEKAGATCRARKTCAPLPVFAANSFVEPARDLFTTGKEGSKYHFAHVNYNTFRHPRMMELSHAVDEEITPSMNMRLNCRHRALHRAAMLRGHNSDAIASKLLKANGEVGPVVVMEFVTGPPWEFNPAMEVSHMLNILHSAKNMEGFAGLAELEEPIQEFLKKPVFDRDSVHANTILEDAVVKPRLFVIANITDQGNFGSSRPS